MTISEKTCALRIRTEQQDPRGLAEVIADEVYQRVPLLAWAEPDPLYVALDNRTGRRGDFTPMVRGMPSSSWLTDLPLVEARLFWAAAALHVVAREGGGCNWMWMEELGTGQALTPTPLPEGEELSGLMREAFRVHTISDRQRFGLSDESVKADLWAIEYRQHGRLVAWRLKVASEENRNA